MEEKTSRLIEYTIEALLISWLVYLFLYQNFLLYYWHRGLPLPSKLPFAVIGIVAGAMFFWYEWISLNKDLENESANSAEITNGLNSEP